MDTPNIPLDQEALMSFQDIARYQQGELPPAWLQDKKNKLMERWKALANMVDDPKPKVLKVHLSTKIKL